MSGGLLLGFILVSMLWLFFFAGLAVNYSTLRRSLRAKEGEQVPSGMGFMPGVAGSMAVFFSIPGLAHFGVEVPWPWLWIALPLLVDPYCLGGFLLLLLDRFK